MRTLMYHIAMTLDGYICHEDGSIDGLLLEGEHAEDFTAAIQNYETVLMGGKTYEFGFQYGLQPGQPAYPNLKHYVFSRSLMFDSNDSVNLVKTDAIKVIEDLKNEVGKDIWLCGGGALAGSLLDAGLIDTVVVKINPVLFGVGRRLFGSSKANAAMQLVNQKRYGNGVMLCRYNLMNPQ